MYFVLNDIWLTELLWVGCSIVVAVTFLCSFHIFFDEEIGVLLSF